MRPVLGKFFAFAAWILILAVKVYKYVISPLLPPACRYYPSCSEYAVTALKRYGLLKGSFLSMKRILRCNPFFPGGYDPVPEK
ncbi:MAG: membrane protein insertion efficiency factor YidD [Spirochaetes bacterium]|nr:membrane protein insertion efficiency factor YidD [Spirochaetota bacterium]